MDTLQVIGWTAAAVFGFSGVGFLAYMAYFYQQRKGRRRGK